MDGRIAATDTIRDVLTRYPGAEPIFNRHGLTGCGGPQGPIEPIGWFATVHNVDVARLLEELNDFVARGTTEPVPSSPAGEEQPEVYRYFLFAALGVAFTVGCTLGATNLTTISLRRSFDLSHLWWWTAHVQAHGHAQIMGWVGLFIMGVAYQVLPRLKGAALPGRRLTMASFWLVLIGLISRVFSQPLIGRAFWAGQTMVLSSLLELVGITLFLTFCLRTLLSSRPLPLFERFLLVGAGWFWLQGAAGLAIAWHLEATGHNAIPARLDVPYLHAALWGFVTFFILGISLRTLPVFMGLRPTNPRAVELSFWSLALGVLLDAAGQLAGLPAMALAGSGLELLGVLAFVQGIHLFRRPVTDVSEAGVERGYEKFVRVAFSWLVASGLMLAGFSIYRQLSGQPVTHALMGAYRHAITVGFITMMIVGMASRIAPVFRGVALYSQPMLNATFALINLGNLLRVGFQSLIPLLGPVSFAPMGISGWLEVSALGLFGFNLVATIRRPVGLMEESSDEIGPRSIVAALLDRYPATLEVFLRHGFTHLRNPVMRNVLARRITVERACQINPTNLADFLAELRQAAHG